MIKNPSGWILAPAYDLLNASIINPEDIEELALNLDGKKRKLKRENFEHLGKVLELTNKQILGVFNRLTKNKHTAIKWIDQSFLSQKMKSAYKELLKKRYFQIEKYK